MGIFIFSKNIKAQKYEWIKNTPTGKVSVWISQLEPEDSLVFELMMINGGEEGIVINSLYGNKNNYFLISEKMKNNRASL